MLSINKVIKILIGADLLFCSAFGFITPIFAIFLVKSVENGSIQLAGTAVAIYWLVKSALRIPVGYFLDKKGGERDDFYSMLIGFSIYSLAHFLYLFAHTANHIYAIQFLMGVGGALAYTPWYGFFTRHIDKHKESFEWGVGISLIGFGTAAAGYIAGFIAEKFGFTPLFIISGSIIMLGVIILLLIGKNIDVKRKESSEYLIKIKNNS